MMSQSWQPDPYGRHTYRLWDGGRWTDQVSDGSGTSFSDPIDPGHPAGPTIDAGPDDATAALPTPMQPNPPSHQPSPPASPSAVYPSPGYPQGQQTPGFNIPGGGPWAAPQQIVVSNASKSPGLAVASLVLGVGAFFFALIPLFGFLSIPFAIVGVALGISGIVRANKGFEGRGLAITGLVTSIAALTISLVYIFALGSAVNDSVDRVNSINSDTPDGFCDTSRFLQDPDC